MNSAYYYSQVAKLEKESADIQKQIADESKRELDKQKDIDSINRSITPSLSLSTIQSKQNQIRSKQSDVLASRTKIADLYKKQADKAIAINTSRQSAAKEEQTERKKQLEDDKKYREQQAKLQQQERDKQKREQEQLARSQQQERDRLKREQDVYQRNMKITMDEQAHLLNQLIDANYSPAIENNLSVVRKKYDVFISHASEDKEEFVRPLAESLTAIGIEVWYDEYTLKLGDSLRGSIDAGLRDSRFGIVVLSPSFFKKNWPQRELDGLVAREMAGGKVILPIWHRITKDEVLAQSPTLADKLAVSTSTHSLADIVDEIRSLLK